VMEKTPGRLVKIVSATSLPSAEAGLTTRAPRGASGRFCTGGSVPLGRLLAQISWSGISPG